MMMLGLFVIVLLAFITAWRGNREVGIGIYGVGLVLAIVVFLHHMTTHLALQL